MKWGGVPETMEAIHAGAVNKRLCMKAHEPARDVNTSHQKIGSICNELKNRIAACRLGCF